MKMSGTISAKRPKSGIFDPKVVDKKVVVVAFNQDGIVDTIEEIKADQINVPTVRRKTPTSGNEITVLQQLVGNVGRFNKEKKKAPYQRLAATANSISASIQTVANAAQGAFSNVPCVQVNT